MANTQHVRTHYRRPPHCSICGEQGHNARNCPTMVVQRTTSAIITNIIKFAHLKNWDRAKTRLVINLIEGTAPVDVSPPQPQKQALPKHISQLVANQRRHQCRANTCQICLTELDADTLVLSKCGHNFCNGCFQDTRVSKCGVCRIDL